MRRALPFVLLLAACTGATVGSTTVPLAEPSTTTTTAPATTTTQPTTTTEEECVDRDGDGVLRTRRGLICPPYLPLADGGTFLAGRFETRVISPGFSFSRDAIFESGGEDIHTVLNQACDRCPQTGAFTGQAALDFIDLNVPNLAWIEDVEQRDVIIGGYPATQIEFGVDEDQCDIASALPDCVVVIEGAGGLIFPPGNWTSLTFVETPGGPIVFNVEADERTFATYWTEVAKPILDSIEFLNP